MDIKWIDDFVSLAQTRNFSRAATERHVTQSALSRRIRSLEEWLGAELVDRGSYPLMLTPAGKLFNNSAAEVLRLLNDTRALVRGPAKDNSVLRIAAGHTLALNFFPQWLKQLETESAPPRFRILPTAVHDSILSLVEGNCDLLLCYSHAELPLELDPAQFDHLTLGSEVMTPVSVPNRAGGAAFPLHGNKVTPTSHLAYTPGCYFARVVECITARTAQSGFFSTVYESDMAEMLKTMALAGHGLAWLPESCIARELVEGKLVRAAGAQWSMTLEIRLVRALDSGKPALDALWGRLRAQKAHLVCI